MIKHYDVGDIRRLALDYDAHGAVHLPGFLGDEPLARLQGVVDAAISQVDQPRSAGTSSSSVRLEGRLTIRYLWRESAALRKVLLQREVARIIAGIIGSQTLRFWFDLTFVHFATEKGDAGIGTPWHHDVPVFSFKGDLMPSLWLALTPTDATLSRLMFIDGSHRTNQGYYRSPEIKEPAPGERDGFVDLPDFDALIARGEVRMLTWDCQPGDAILLHPATIHGALGHSRNGKCPRRVAMTTRWLGDDVRFLPYSYERAIQHPAAAQTNLMFGQRPHGEWFPLVYDASVPGSNAPDSESRGQVVGDVQGLLQSETDTRNGSFIEQLADEGYAMGHAAGRIENR
jgi:ectoine hydroxylase-related dioxygenase (phytanoyl-CoA dioxygenase family)